jgi:hypothetical protein
LGYGQPARDLLDALVMTPAEARPAPRLFSAKRSPDFFWNDCCFPALAPMIENPFLALTIGGIAALTIALVVAVSVL